MQPLVAPGGAHRALPHLTHAATTHAPTFDTMLSMLPPCKSGCCLPPPVGNPSQITHRAALRVGFFIPNSRMHAPPARIAPSPRRSQLAVTGCNQAYSQIGPVNPP